MNYLVTSTKTGGVLLRSWPEFADRPKVDGQILYEGDDPDAAEALMAEAERKDLESVAIAEAEAEAISKTVLAEHEQSQQALADSAYAKHVAQFGDNAYTPEEFALTVGGIVPDANNGQDNG